MEPITFEPSASGFAIRRGEKALLTPFGMPLVLPTLALAQAIAREWEAQGKIIRKETMPLMGIACIALDVADTRREELLKDILPYLDTDLICYRSNIPELAALQKERLSPVLAWARETHALEFHITDGIMPITQPSRNREHFSYAVRDYDAWRLAAFAAAVKPLTSIVLALAFTEGNITAGEAFSLSQMEEAYETSQWGEDTEKQQKTSQLEIEVISAGRFLQFLNHA